MAIVTTYQRAFNGRRLDPYPVEILKRVDRPTTLIKEAEVERVDERENGFDRAQRGDFGPWGDEMMGYVKPRLERKWWFDLEDVDGVLKVPSRAGERGNNRPPNEG